ncbi:hypothetical protein KIM372_17370 [Bombiscardovia nodaiensis]|uniref:Peptidase n=1 Tax=Bombiscardovia nodaiensis TaxID=2932181 RepID=A0ABN6SG25_9BIFI|nr:hypothetical protein KIM372_17370 [Bombiscardovia nodaiensis]
MSGSTSFRQTAPGRSATAAPQASAGLGTGAFTSTSVGTSTSPNTGVTAHANAATRGLTQSIASSDKPSSKPAADQPLPVADRIIAALSSGQPPQVVAQNLGLPLDFITMVTEQARRSGQLNYYELESGNCGLGTGCQPDPESLVCASCPILPAAIRRQQSPFARLRQALSSSKRSTQASKNTQL